MLEEILSSVNEGAQVKQLGSVPTQQWEQMVVDPVNQYQKL